MPGLSRWRSIWGPRGRAGRAVGEGVSGGGSAAGPAGGARAETAAGIEFFHPFEVGDYLSFLYEVDD